MTWCVEVPAGAAADEGHLPTQSGEARVQLPDPQKARRGEHRHQVSTEAQNHQTPRRPKRTSPETRQTGEAVQVRALLLYTVANLNTLLLTIVSFSDYRDDNLKLVDDYKHVVEQLLDLQNKSKYVPAYKLQIICVDFLHR